MKLTPFSELSQHYRWFLIATLIGLPIGYFGIGPIAYFGPIILVGTIITIFRSKNAKKRVILWGLLLGISTAFFTTLSIYGWHE